MPAEALRFWYSRAPISADRNDQFVTEVFVQENNPINGDVVAFNNGSNAGGLAGSGTNKEIFADGIIITFDGSTFLPSGSGAVAIGDLNTALRQLTFSSNVDPTGGGQRTSANFSFQFVDSQNMGSGRRHPAEIEPPSAHRQKAHRRNEEGRYPHHTEVEIDEMLNGLGHDMNPPIGHQVSANSRHS